MNSMPRQLHPRGTSWEAEQLQSSDLTLTPQTTNVRPHTSDLRPNLNPQPTRQTSNLRPHATHLTPQTRTDPTDLTPDTLDLTPHASHLPHHTSHLTPCNLTPHTRYLSPSHTFFRPTVHWSEPQSMFQCFNPVFNASIHFQ